MVNDGHRLFSRSRREEWRTELVPRVGMRGEVASFPCGHRRGTAQGRPIPGTFQAKRSSDFTVLETNLKSLDMA